MSAPRRTHRLTQHLAHIAHASRGEGDLEGRLERRMVRSCPAPGAFDRSARDGEL